MFCICKLTRLRLRARALWLISLKRNIISQCYIYSAFIALRSSLYCRQRWWRRRRRRLISISSVLFIFICLFHYSYKMHVQPDGNALLLNTNDSGFTRMNMALNTLKRILSQSSIRSLGHIDQSQHSIAIFLKCICILVDTHTHIPTPYTWNLNRTTNSEWIALMNP